MAGQTGSRSVGVYSEHILKGRDLIVRRNNGKGGMCTSRSHYSIYCPFCGKPAFSAELGTIEIYKHFTKNGTVSHIKDENGNWKRKRGVYQ
jgi:hypothetical protein